MQPSHKRSKQFIFFYMRAFSQKSYESAHSKCYSICTMGYEMQRDLPRISKSTAKDNPIYSTKVTGLTPASKKS
jgi:hypothetical protein